MAGVWLWQFATLTTHAGESAGAEDPDAIRWSYPLFLDGLQTEGPRAYALDQPEGVYLVLDSLAFKPGQRWLEFWLDRGDHPTAAVLQVNLQLLDPLDDTIWAKSTYDLGDGRVWGEIDRKAMRGQWGLLDITIHERDTLVGRHRLILSLPEETPPEIPANGIDLQIDFPAGLDPEQVYPFTLGVPFAPGQWWGDGSWQLLGPDDSALPIATEITATWFPGGSVKWLRVDGLSRPVDSLRLSHLPKTAQKTTEAMVSVHEDSVVVNTGASQWTIGKDAALLREWTFAGITRAVAPHPGLYVTDQNGRVATASAENAELEIVANADNHAAIRITGSYVTGCGESLARHISWFEFNRGWPGARVTHTLILTRDSNEIWFTDVGWSLRGDVTADKFTAGAGLSMTAPFEYTQWTLGGGDELAVAQVDHPRFGGGMEQLVVHQILNGQEQILAEQTGRIAGWISWYPDNLPGLMLQCRRAALLHPKEFLANDSGLELKLFSPRGGEALDFRMPSLLERWNRGGELERNQPMRDRTAQLQKMTTNAVGWARTHEILLLPFEAPQAIAAVSQAHAFEEGVQAMANPKWIRQSTVMGSFYPQDGERFPLEEARIEKAWERWQESGFARMQSYGFVDYFAGPHYRDQLGQVRQRSDYWSRDASWLLYVRSGARPYRTFAEGTWLSYMDLYLAHADGPNKMAGVPLNATGLYDRFPFYWEEYTRFNNMRMTGFLNMYYLTGNRRAGDVIQSMVLAMPRWLATNPAIFRRASLINAPLELYQFSWDPALRDVFEQFVRAEYDPAGYLGRRRGAAYHSAYKIRSDNAPVIDAWRDSGDPRLYDLALRFSRFSWPSFLGTAASRYMRGRVAQFLVEQDEHPKMVLESLALAVRMLVADTRNPASWSAPSYLYLPYSLEVLATSDADLKPMASYAGAVSHGEPMQVFILKDSGPVHLFVAGADRADLKAAPNTQRRNPNLSEVINTERYLRINIPADDNPGIYHLSLYPSERSLVSASLSDAGEASYGIYAFADRLLPMVVYAPDGWQPAPGERETPRMPVFFKVPQSTQQAILHTSGSILLKTPDGAPYPVSGEPVQGDVVLPADQPGLWSFQVVEDGLIQCSGSLLPIFATRNPNAWFNPLEDWALKD